MESEISSLKAENKKQSDLIDRLQEIMINAGKLDKKVDYNKLVNTKYMIK